VCTLLSAAALGKIPIDVNEMGIDAMSMSGHKVSGQQLCSFRVALLTF